MVYNKDSKNESPKEKITMRIIKAKDYDDMSRKAANIMASVITLDPSCTLGLATGSTPIGLYKNLIAAYENGNLDFSKVHSINLDGTKPRTAPTPPTMPSRIRPLSQSGLWMAFRPFSTRTGMPGTHTP